MKRSTKQILLFVVFITITSLTYSQGPGPCPNPPCDPPNPVGLPIDGGLIFLLIAGLLFGVRKLRQR